MTKPEDCVQCGEGFSCPEHKPKAILIRRPNGRVEMREWPSERPLASGSQDAVVAAAHLIVGNDWEWERLYDAATREIKEQEDARVFGACQ